MIPKETIDRIIDAARVEEVIGDFITLRKRGANLLGLCPFHGEKTPSFTVSPAKGIYKCFGCGKAGTAVNFIMDQENMTYPEALRYLAKKYNIEIVEKEISPEERAVQNEKESLYIVAQYGQKYFSDILHTTDEGKSVGLGYFIERGFRPDIIEKFQLGYSLEERRNFSETAVKNGYRPEYLVKTGLSILSDRHQEGTPIEVKDIFDRYTNRVIFPIHNVTGRVIGFGGRILTNDKKLAKYINSPQTDIYDKSRVLYGLYFAKKAIVQEEVCYLVEGYTDVISMHQAGIENVVASSGTSLTIEQIKLIHRFTNNITILYDGDFAGIKASFRGIDLILEEGMNVRVLLFPDGDDPDSYSKKVGSEELKHFIKANSKDFIGFKTGLLYEDARHDPIKKAGLIKEIVESISLIPDAIMRSVYVQECATIMDIEEQLLQVEVNKLRRKKGEKVRPGEHQEASGPEEPSVADLSEEEFLAEEEKKAQLFDGEERELMRMMLQYGNVLVEIDAEDGEKEKHTLELTLGEYVAFELLRDHIVFTNPIYQMVIEEYMHQLEQSTIPMLSHFVNHPNPAISTVAIEIAAVDHQLSKKWNDFGIYIQEEIYIIKRGVQHMLYSLKEKRLAHMISGKQEQIRKASNDDEILDLMRDIHHLTQLKVRVNKLMGRIVTR